MEVTVYGPLRSATGQKQIHVAFDGGTVAQALDAFVTAYPRAERQLCTDADRLAPSVRLLVDDTAVAPEEECPPDATLSIHPAMRGG